MIGDGDEVDNDDGDDDHVGNGKDDDDGDDDHVGNDDDHEGDDEDSFSLSQVLLFDLADPSICTGYVA